MLMQVPAVSTPSNNTSFNARLQVIGNARKLLPKNSVGRLQAKAKMFGTDDDVIFIGITPHVERGIKFKRNIFGGIDEVPYIASWNTNITMSHCCPGIKSYEVIDKEELIPWKKGKKGVMFSEWEINKIGAYKSIFKYIDSLKEKFAAKK